MCTTVVLKVKRTAETTIGAIFREEVRQTLSLSMNSELTYRKMENSEFSASAWLNQLIWVGSVNSEFILYDHKKPTVVAKERLLSLNEVYSFNS